MVDLTGEEEALIKDIWDNSDTNEEFKEIYVFVRKERKKERK